MHFLCGPEVVTIDSFHCNTPPPLSLFQVILGKAVSRDALLDQALAQELVSCQDDDSFQTVLSGTMCTDDFYEGAAVNVHTILSPDNVHVHACPCTCTYMYMYMHVYMSKDDGKSVYYRTTCI